MDLNLCFDRNWSLSDISDIHSILQWSTEELTFCNYTKLEKCVVLFQNDTLFFIRHCQELSTYNETVGRKNFALIPQLCASTLHFFFFLFLLLPFKVNITSFRLKKDFFSSQVNKVSSSVKLLDKA